TSMNAPSCPAARFGPLGHIIPGSRDRTALRWRVSDSDGSPGRERPAQRRARAAAHRPERAGRQAETHAHLVAFGWRELRGDERRHRALWQAGELALERLPEAPVLELLQRIAAEVEMLGVRGRGRVRR